MTVLSSRAARRFAAVVLALAAAIALKTSPVPVAAAGGQETRADPGQAPQPQIDVDARLKGFDDYRAQVMRDWNAPGIGIGIVVKDKLVFAKGYGFRDFGKKLPYTPTTTQPIASNSKLFTAVAVGLLVEEGKLRWDEPIKRFVPGIRFYNDDLDRSVTIRDMLSHRTGVTRHDAIWYKSAFTRRELWDRLRYLEPAAPIRTTFLYNNLMYTAAGQVVEELSGLTWEQFVQRRIFDALGMSRSTLTIDDNLKGPEPAVPYSERRDSTELYRQPYYTAEVAIAPAGAIIEAAKGDNGLLRDICQQEEMKAAQQSLKEMVKGKDIDTLRRQVRETALAKTRTSLEILHAKGAKDDADAYRKFVTVIADRVAKAAKEGGFLGFGGERVSENEKTLLADLSSVVGTVGP